MKERCCVGIPQPISNSSQTLWNLQSWELSQAQVCLTHWLADASIHLSIHLCIHPPTHHPSKPHLCVCAGSHKGLKSPFLYSFLLAAIFSSLLYSGWSLWSIVSISFIPSTSKLLPFCPRSFSYCTLRLAFISNSSFFSSLEKLPAHQRWCYSIPSIS